MLRSIIVLTAGLSLTACVSSPPLSPMQIAANQWAGAQVAVEQCAPWIGGFGDARELREEANEDLRRARQLGATDAVLNAARQDVNGKVMGAAFMVGAPQACSSLVASLGTSPNPM